MGNREALLAVVHSDLGLASSIQAVADLCEGVVGGIITLNTDVSRTRVAGERDVIMRVDPPHRLANDEVSILLVVVLGVRDVEAFREVIHLLSIGGASKRAHLVQVRLAGRLDGDTAALRERGVPGHEVVEELHLRTTIPPIRGYPLLVLLGLVVVGCVLLV